MKITIKNPARARPLSANVRRLMTMARESPLNPDVEKITREFNERDLAYCDMQGNIFMAAVDRGVSMDIFAPLYRRSRRDHCRYSSKKLIVDSLCTETAEIPLTSLRLLLNL